MELCLIREGLARHCTEAETAFAVQGLGSFPMLQSGRRASSSTRGCRGSRRGEAVAGFALTEPEPAATSRRSRSRPTPRRRGLPLTGEKIYISNAPDADVYSVFARTTEGAGARGRHGVLGPRDSPGLEGRAHRARLAAPHRPARLRRRPRRPRAGPRRGRRGFRVAMRTLDLFRPASARSRSGWRRPRSPPPATTPPRAQAFGRPLKDFQGGLAPPRGRRHARAGGAGCSSHHAATAYDRGIRPVTQTAAMAKLLATEVAQEAVDVADAGPRRQRARARPRPRAPVPRGARAAHLRRRVRDPARDHRPRAVRLHRRRTRDEDRHHRRRARRACTPRSCFSRLAPAHEVTVCERNAPDDTFGFGVVFSDETLDRLRGGRPGDATPRSRAASRAGPTSRSTTAGTVQRSGGHGFCGARAARTLLNILQAARASSASTCGSSRRRRRSTSCRRGRPRHRRRRRRQRRCATRSPSTSARRSTAPVQVHVARHRPRLRRVHVPIVRDRARASSRSTAYPYDETMSTFIVETDEDVARAGLDAREAQPSRRARTTTEHRVRRELFADILAATRSSRTTRSG